MVTAAISYQPASKQANRSEVWQGSFGYLITHQLVPLLSHYPGLMYFNRIKKKSKKVKLLVFIRQRFNVACEIVLKMTSNISNVPA